MNYQWAISEFFTFFFVLGRLIGLISFMPLTSLSEVPKRFRFFAALSFAYVLTPTLHISSAPSIAYSGLALIFIKELIIGSFIGLIGRLLLSMLDIAGMMISNQIGLSSATVMNPDMQGSALTSSILILFGTALFLSLDLHYLMLSGLVHSYTLFPINEAIITGDMAKGYIELFSKVFWFGIQLSLPFVIVFLVMQIGFGLMNRIIPQVQIFFVSLPFQLWAGFVVFLLTASVMLDYFAKVFSREFSALLKLG